jgi:hypothetical protein
MKAVRHTPAAPTVRLGAARLGRAAVIRAAFARAFHSPNAEHNAQMAYIQRPGARVIASEFEWKREGRSVQPDAIPIIILWPRSPIRFVYELEDTGPPIDRAEVNDPFAVVGQLHPKVLTD